MDTRTLFRTDLTAVEKRYKKGKELTDAEKVSVAQREDAKGVAMQCCGVCAVAKDNSSTEEKEAICKECYPVYNESTKRFWLSRYKRSKG